MNLSAFDCHTFVYILRNLSLNRQAKVWLVFLQLHELVRKYSQRLFCSGSLCYRKKFLLYKAHLFSATHMQKHCPLIEPMSSKSYASQNVYLSTRTLNISELVFLQLDFLLAV